MGNKCFEYCSMSLAIREMKLQRWGGHSQGLTDRWGATGDQWLLREGEIIFSE